VDAAASAASRYTGPNYAKWEQWVKSPDDPVTVEELRVRNRERERENGGGRRSSGGRKRRDRALQPRRHGSIALARSAVA
jgi:hypothetical protein